MFSFLIVAHGPKEPAWQRDEGEFVAELLSIRYSIAYTLLCHVEFLHFFYSVDEAIQHSLVTLVHLEEGLIFKSG